MLQKIDTITLEDKTPQTDTIPPSCELVINGKPTGRRVAGYALDAAYQCDTGYLVFLNHDCPFEETLSIYLLDATGALQDSAHLGGMYTTGYFRNDQLIQPDKMSFEFFADATWTVHLLSKPHLRMPLFSEPLGITRPFGFQRHFVITKTLHTKNHAPIVLWVQKIVKKLRPMARRSFNTHHTAHGS